MEKQFENQLEKKIEVMDMPDVVIEREKGHELMSLIKKGYLKGWNKENELETLGERYFKEEPLDPEFVEFFKEIKAFDEDGVDSETLFNMAMTYKSKSRNNSAKEMIRKYKPHVKDADKLQEKLLVLLEKFEDNYSGSDLGKKYDDFVSEDIKKRKENLEDYKDRIKKIIEFFQPDKKTSEPRKINLMPTNTFAGKLSGVNYSFGSESVIEFNIDNPDNLEHEFLHNLINPIVEKLVRNLSEEKKRKIVELTSRKLKIDQEYGEDSFVLLSEEIIRTYNDVFSKDETPMSLEKFQAGISGLTEVQFKKIKEDNELSKKRLDEFGIKNVKDLKENAAEYYERYMKNELRDIVYNIYKDYQKEKDANTNFEIYLSNNFDKYISG